MTGWAHLTGFLPGACRNLLQAGMGLALQSTLVLLAGLLAGRRLRRRGPAAAALVYRATALATLLGALLALAIGGRFQPRWAIALPPAEEAAIRAPAPDITAGRETPAIPMPRFVPAGGPGLGIAPTGSEASHLPEVEQNAGLPLGGRASRNHVDGPALNRSSLPLQTTPIGWLYVILAGVWGAGAAVLLAGLALCYRSMGHLRKGSVPAGQEAVEMLRRLCETRRLRPPLLRVSPRVQSPVLAGLRRPAILLPASYQRDFDAPALRAVLAHELAHLERGDCGWFLLVRLACAVGWVQPLGWALARRLEASSEEVCDQEVLRRDASPHDYARCLIDLAARLVPSRLERAIGAGIAPCHSALERRVRNILSGAHASSPLTSRLRAAVLMGSVAAMSAGLLLVSASAAPPAAPAKDPLADDARLAQKVKVTVEGLPVSDLLARLAQKTGIWLAAGRETADDKVIVFGPARPLREILADLAALFNDRWERRTAEDGIDRYTLVRDLPAQQYEAGLVRAVTERILAQWDGPVHSLSETPEELARRPDDDSVRKLLTDPKSRLAIRLYSLLSPEQRETLLARGRLPIRFAGLTPEQQTAVRSVFTQVVNQEQEEAETERKAGFSWPVSRPEELEEAGIRFETRHLLAMSSVELLLGRSSIAFSWVDSRIAWLLPPHGNPYTSETVPADAALPDIRAAHRAAAAKAWPDRLRKLAAESGMAVMADYYRGRPVVKPYDDPEAYRGWSVAQRPEDPAIPSANASVSALDTLCEPDGYLWWPRGKSLLLRSRAWYRQRLYEVPDRWLLSMVGRLEAQKGVPTYGDVLRVLELTPEQLMGLSSLAEAPGWFGFQGQIRELLAILQAGPNELSAPVPAPEHGLSREASERTWLKYPALTPAQRRLLPAFLDAYPYPVSAAKAPSFQARLRLDPFAAQQLASMMRSPTGARLVLDPDYRYVTVTLAFSLGDEGRIWLNSIRLPASLPDDRRDRTRIEVVP